MKPEMKITHSTGNTVEPKFKEVTIFSALISEMTGRIVHEKVYHGALDEAKTIGGGAVIWCVFNTKKQKWGKWHVKYFLIGHPEYYDSVEELVMKCLTDKLQKTYGAKTN